MHLCYKYACYMHCDAAMQSLQEDEEQKPVSGLDRVHKPWP